MRASRREYTTMARVSRDGVQLRSRVLTASWLPPSDPGTAR
jgi:hypothetical protein